MTYVLKLFLFLSAAFVAACGGGGGFSGTPTGPSAALRVFPPVESMTVPVGYSYATVQVQGGRAPYVVTSSNPSVAASLVDGNLIQVAGRGAGTSEVAVVDQERVVVKFQVTAVLIPMKSTIGTDVSVRPRQSLTFDISGGVGPYRIRTSNNAIFTVSPEGIYSNGPFVLTGLTEGTGTLTVTDSTDTDFVMNITVKAVPIVVTPSSGSGKAGTSIKLILSGGQAPYTVSSMDPTVADGSVVGDELTVSLKKKGSTKLLVRDAQGITQSVDITVDDSSLTVAPASGQIFGKGQKLDFTLSGGVPPYFAVVSNSTAASAVISSDNTKMTVTSIACPATLTVSVFDQTGSFRDVSVAILPLPPATTCP